MNTQIGTVVPTGKKDAPWYMGAGGATAFTRSEAQRFARSLVEDADYRKDLQRRLNSGKLNPVIESMLWHYAYGKPLEQIAVQVSQTQESLSELSLEELQARARELSDKIAEARELAEAIPVIASKVA